MRKRYRATGISLLAGLLLLAGCRAAGVQEDGVTAEVQQEITAEDPQGMEHTDDGAAYVQESIPEESFAYTVTEDAERGDRILTIRNVSDQDYSYIQADLLFYDAGGELVDYYSSVGIYNMLAGMEQIVRFSPNRAGTEYASTEVLFSGNRMDAARTLDPSGIKIEEQTRLSGNNIVTRCANATGEDLSTIYFQICYYKDGALVGTDYREQGTLAKDSDFLVIFSSPMDGWYNELPEDFYDSYEIEVLRVTAMYEEAAD